MKPVFRKMMRNQIQADLDNPAYFIHKPVPRGGWIKIIRRIFGMTSYQLAKRLQCSQSNIAALERREKQKTISLQSLESAAQALHCKLVYFFVPEKPFEKILEDRACVVAKIPLQSGDHSMELEQQGLTPTQKKQQEKDLVEELLQGNLKELWDLEDEI